MRFHHTSRHLLALCLSLPLLAIAQGVKPAAAGNGPDPKKILRYAFEVAETSLDPQKVSDVYSSIVNNAMFDTPLRYDHLARPAKLIPNTLVAMPDVSSDYRTFTLRVKPGIYFADHEVFGGKKRELTVVAIEPLPVSGWFVGGAALEAGESGAVLEIRITEGTNTKAQKAAFIRAAFDALAAALPGLNPASYVTLHEPPADAWGYSGKTQEYRFIHSQML